MWGWARTSQPGGAVSFAGANDMAMVSPGKVDRVTPPVLCPTSDPRPQPKLCVAMEMQLDSRFPPNGV
jgi:hypothetical protein